MYAVIRIRGEAGERKGIKDTLKMLNLVNKFECSLVPENDSFEGMLEKVKNFVTWGEVDDGMAKKIIEMSGSESPDGDFEKVVDGESKDELGLKNSVNLHPPSGGFNGSTKKLYPKGEGGYRGEEVNRLLEKMM